MKRTISMLLVFIMCLSFVPVMKAEAAVEYSKARVDAIMKNWNNSTYSDHENNAYQGATQCAAFTRYVFVNLYEHTDRLGEGKNTFPLTKDGTKYDTLSDLFNALKTYAKPGDNFRVENSKGTHIVHLNDISANGVISLYESNLSSKTTTNEARFSQVTLEKFLEEQTYLANVDDSTGKLNPAVTLKIIHASENTDTVLSCNKKPAGTNNVTQQTNACKHAKYTGGYCTSCGKEYNYKITAKTAYYKVNKADSDSAPVWNRPYSDKSTKVDRLKNNSVVCSVGYTTNQHGHKWLLLSDGSWLYSGNAKSASKPQDMRFVYNTDGCLCLNKTAKSGGTVLDYIPEGGAVEVISTSGTYWKVKYNGITGYAHKNYLTKTAPQISIYEGKTAVPVYSKANASSAKRITVPAGDDIVVFTNRTNNGFTIAYYNNQTAGYINLGSLVKVR